MKSKRRHELQQNTLQTELRKAGDFFNKHGTKIGLVALALALGFLGWVLWSRHMEGRKQDVLYQYDTVVSRMQQSMPAEMTLASKLEELSMQDHVEWIAADSLYRLAQLNLQHMLLAETEEERRRFADTSRDYLEKLRRDFDEMPNFVAASLIAEGKIHESFGEYDQARSKYEQALNLPGLAGYPMTAQARMAISRLDELSDQDIRLATFIPDWLEDIRARRRAEAEAAEAADPQGMLEIPETGVEIENANTPGAEIMDLGGEEGVVETPMSDSDADESGEEPLPEPDGTTP